MEFEKKKVLITGGCGFIGYHLVKRFLQEDGKVCVLDKKIEKKLSNKVEYHSVDITNKKKVKDIVRNFSPEYIIHLAAHTGKRTSLKDIEHISKINLLATIQLLSLCNALSYKKFIFMSTTEVYAGNKTPFKEDMKIGCVSAYSASKAASELYCYIYYNTYNKPITILRPTVIYGPGQPSEMFIAGVINALLHGKDFPMTPGEQKRDFVYITDAVEAIVKSCNTTSSSGEIINIGTGKEYSLRQIIKTIKDVFSELGITVNYDNLHIGALKYRSNEFTTYFCDITKARKILSWIPNYDIKRGIKETIEWHLEKEKN